MRKRPLPKSGMDDNEEFESMYRLHEPSVRRFMYWRTKDTMQAQDLTSSVFEKAWRTRANFSGGSSKAWIFRIARTTLIDYWRKKKEVAMEDGAADNLIDESTPIDESLDQEFLQQRLAGAVKKLSPEMRVIVHYRFIEHKTVQEVSELVGKSEANVRVLQYRALKKLKGYLK